VQGETYVTHTWQCPQCGAPLDLSKEVLVICGYCGARVIVPEELRVKDASAGSSPTAVESLIPQPVSSPSPTELENELRELIQQGQKIQAIKRYREVYATGLKESKDAVEALEASGVLPIPAVPYKPATGLNSDAVIGEVIRMGLDGKKIEAIRLYREHFDVGLAEAKNVVEQLIADSKTDPAWAAESARRELAQQRGILQDQAKKESQYSIWLGGCAPFIIVVVLILVIIVVLNLVIMGRPF
jgi:ribosomal protein L7/L12